MFILTYLGSDLSLSSAAMLSNRSLQRFKHLHGLLIYVNRIKDRSQSLDVILIEDLINRKLSLSLNLPHVFSELVLMYNYGVQFH